MKKLWRSHSITSVSSTNSNGFHWVKHFEDAQLSLTQIAAVFRDFDSDADWTFQGMEGASPPGCVLEDVHHVRARNEAREFRESREVETPRAEFVPQKEAFAHGTQMGLPCPDVQVNDHATAFLPEARPPVQPAVVPEFEPPILPVQRPRTMPVREVPRIAKTPATEATMRPSPLPLALPEPDSRTMRPSEVKGASGRENPLLGRVRELVPVAQEESNPVWANFLDDLQQYLKHQEEEFNYMKVLVQQKEAQIEHLKDSARKRQDEHLKESARRRKNSIPDYNKKSPRLKDDVSNEPSGLLLTLALVELGQAKAVITHSPPLQQAASESFLGIVLRQRDKQIAQMEQELAVLRKSNVLSSSMASTTSSQSHRAETREERLRRCVEEGWAQQLSKSRTVQLEQQSLINELQLKLHYKEQELSTMSLHVDAAARELAQVRETMRKTATTAAGSMRSIPGDDLDALDLSHSYETAFSDEDSLVAA